MDFQEPMNTDSRDSFNQDTFRLVSFLIQLLTDNKMQQGVKLALDAFAGKRNYEWSGGHDSNYGGDQDPKQDMDSMRYNIQQLAQNSSGIYDIGHKLSELNTTLTTIHAFLSTFKFGAPEQRRDTLPELERAVSESRRIELDKAEARDALYKEQIEELITRSEALSSVTKKKNTLLRELLRDVPLDVKVLKTKLQAILDVVD